MKHLVLLGVSLTLAFSFGCKPFKGEVYEEIAPNETAFVIPLEGASKDNQGKFDSIEFLEERKVAAKRINIPRRDRQVGRAPWNVEYIPVVRVIKVDRSPLSRHWTSDRETGTSSRDEAIYVESKDSIGFGVGITITAAVEEANTATYLYHFPQARPLSEVIDNDVKAFITSVLAREFGGRDLAQCKTEKADAVKVAFEESAKYWKGFGITIRTLGHSGGLHYENPKIQEAIDRNYEAEMEIERQENMKVAQLQENERLLSIEDTKRKAAEIFNQALEAQREKIRLEIDRMRAEADLKRAEKWNGQLPANILPEGSPLLYGLPSQR